MSKPSELLGKWVRAKRAGLDEPAGGLVTENDILELPAWRDDGLPEWVEGVLAAMHSLGGGSHLPWPRLLPADRVPRPVGKERVAPFRVPRHYSQRAESPAGL